MTKAQTTEPGLTWNVMIGGCKIAEVCTGGDIYTFPTFKKEALAKAREMLREELGDEADDIGVQVKA